MIGNRRPGTKRGPEREKNTNGGEADRQYSQNGKHSRPKEGKGETLMRALRGTQLQLETGNVAQSSNASKTTNRKTNTEEGKAFVSVESVRRKPDRPGYSEGNEAENS